MARNSLELRKKLSLSEFYRLSQKIATEYATTPASTARSTFLEKYDITESTYYFLLEMSITHHLVSDKIVKSIREKILANQSTHGNNGYVSTVKYNRLEKERTDFSAFTKQDIRKIAEYYANNPQCSKQETANHFHFYSTKPLDQLLKKACVELIVTDKVFNALYSRAIQNATDMEYTVRFFEKLAQARANTKSIKKTPKSAF